GEPDTNYFPEVSSFANLQPRIAALFRDWVTDQNPDGAGIWLNTSLPSRVVVTWKRMRPYGEGGEVPLLHPSTFQVVLFADGRVQIGYDGVLTRDGIVGITPGGEATVARGALVTQVVFPVGGYTFPALVEPPYQVWYGVPLGATSLTVQADVTDNQGLTATATRTVPVAPDPPPTVALTDPPAGATL